VCVGMRSVCIILVRNLEGKKPLRESSCRLEDNIKMHVMEVRRDCAY
jgi:hypothetical protein